jgi:predicted MFS family arabinose efflux permease
MAVSGVVVALAPNYPVYMMGRALIGVVIGGFWSLSAATAMRLVPAAKVPRALAIFNSGNALATVVAAPLGSYLGGMIGWRGAFLCLLPVAAIALAWQWVCLPSMPAESGQSQSGLVALFQRRVVVLGMLACGAFFMGQFALFTYVRPFLERVTSAGTSAVPLVLLAIGVSGFVGTLVIGAFIRRGLYRTLVTIPALMALIAVALVALGPQLWPTAALLSAWGLLATAAPVGWWSWLARTFTDNAEAGGGLMVAVVQCSIALGSTVGGLLFDSLGFASTFLASAGLLLCAALLARSWPVLACCCAPRCSLMPRRTTGRPRRGRWSLWNPGADEPPYVDHRNTALPPACVRGSSGMLCRVHSSRHFSQEGRVTPGGSFHEDSTDHQRSDAVGLIRLGRIEGGLQVLRTEGPLAVRIESD